MIDRIRQDIENRLEQLLAEADKLRHALAELGSGDGNRGRSSAPRRRGGRARAAGDTGAGATGGRGRRAETSGASGSARGSRSSTARGGSATRSRSASGGTKNAVLATLASADGAPMTAGEVAASTGLGRASVSTTLSKLARSGEVTKAERGYRLAGGGGGAGAGGGAAAATVEAVGEA